MSPIEKGVLMLVLGLAGLIYLLPFAAGLYMERKDRKKRGEPDNSKAQYDERQKLIRLTAYTHTFYVLMGYLLVWLVLEFMGALRWEGKTIHLLAGGLMLALTVANGECILRGAMLGYNQRGNENSQITMYLLLGVCWTLTGWVNLGARSASLGVMQLLMGISYAVMGALMLYARRRRKQAEQRLDAGDGAE